jgi:hypothetical protein
MKGEPNKMGRYKFVSGEMPAARLDLWCQKILNENAELELVSYTEVAGSPGGYLRATFIFNDPVEEFETNMDLAIKSFCLDDKDDEPDSDVEGSENVLQIEDLDPSDLDNAGGC